MPPKPQLTAERMRILHDLDRFRTILGLITDEQARSVLAELIEEAEQRLRQLNMGLN